VGADTRTSVSGYVSNRYANKITFILDKEEDIVAIPFNPDLSMTRLFDESNSLSSTSPEGSTCCICRSGSASDTQYLADIVRLDSVSRQIMNYFPNTVSSVAKRLRCIMLEEDLSASLICTGYDHVLKRGIIYSLSPGGAWIEEPLWTTSGSGSSYIMGYLESKLSDRMADSLSEDEALALTASSIKYAMSRDTNSGGFIVLHIINKDGKHSRTRLC
jgi:20S proteasome subunit beta 1